MGGKSGRLIPLTDKLKAIELIEEAYSSGARLHKATAELLISVRTFHRWKRLQETHQLEDRRAAASRVHSSKLTEEDEEKMLEVLADPQYANMSPKHFVPLLAQNGTYIACESSFYRLMKARHLLTHRRRSKAPQQRMLEALVAFKPNQVWSWDISYLPTSVKGQYFYLYIVMDLFSRFVVAHDIYPEEAGENAAQLIALAAKNQKIHPHDLCLHSDNGSPMKSYTMLAKLHELGIMSSFSRPNVSNDNPYSESLFKTAKYHVSYPSEPFATLEDARDWGQAFVKWYNHEHLHSGIKFVTPSQRHHYEDKELLAKRALVYQEAALQYASRFRGKLRSWSYIEEVVLNRYKSKNPS